MRHLLLALLVACSSTKTVDGSSKPDGSTDDPSTHAGGDSSNTGGDPSNTDGGSSITDGGAPGNGGSANNATAGDASSSGASTVGDAAGDSCNAIFSCVGQCSDDPCSNACYDKGSAAGKQKIDALVACLSENGCSDATCAKQYCSQELDECINDVSVSPDTGPPVTQGNIDSSLVGDWMGSSIAYHFDANGSYFMVGRLASAGDCIAFDHIDITNRGVARTQGNMLTTTATTSKQVTTDCAGDQTTKTSPGNTDHFTWSISGSTLTMVGDTGAIDYQKQ